MTFGLGQFIIGLVLVILQITTVVAVAITKFNDLAHLEKNVKDLDEDFKTSIAVIQEDNRHKHLENKEKIDEILDKLNKFHIAVVSQKAVCEERHKKD